MKELVQQINELGVLTPQANLEVIIRSTNAAPERRIAAVLWHVSCSSLPISSAVNQLIMTLQTPGWDAKDVEDPTATQVGQMILSHLDDDPANLYQTWMNPDVGVIERMACQLVLRSIKASYPSNESLDLVLKTATGRDAVWWIDWIMEQRKGEK